MSDVRRRPARPTAAAPPVAPPSVGRKGGANVNCALLTCAGGFRVSFHLDLAHRFNYHKDTQAIKKAVACGTCAASAG
jgi:hypothetical protein